MFGLLYRDSISKCQNRRDYSSVANACSLIDKILFTVSYGPLRGCHLFSGKTDGNLRVVPTAVIVNSLVFHLFPAHAGHYCVQT